MGLGQDVNNQKKELGEMALVAGQSFKIDEVTITAGGITEEQQSRWEQNIGKSVDERSYSHLNPEQKFYLCLAAEGFKLEDAEDRAHQLGMTSQELETAQEALALQVNDDDQVTAVTRPSFVGADFVTDPEIKKLLEAAVVKSPRCLYGADLEGANLYGAQLREADLEGADLWGADLRNTNLEGAKLWFADLREAYLKGAQMQGACLWGADLQGVQGADLMGAYLAGVDISDNNFKGVKNLNYTLLNWAFYYQDNPPEHLENALEGVKAKQRPMALTWQEYNKVCDLRDSNSPSDFADALERLRNEYNEHINRQELYTAKAKFAWWPTKVAIMFSSGFNQKHRDELYGNGVGGKFLQGISDRLEALNHLVGRGNR
jgi:hypothetical protein